MKSLLTAFETLARDSAKTPILWKRAQLQFTPASHPLTWSRVSDNLMSDMFDLRMVSDLSDKSTLQPSRESFIVCKEEKKQGYPAKQNEIERFSKIYISRWWFMLSTLWNLPKLWIFSTYVFRWWFIYCTIQDMKYPNYYQYSQKIYFQMVTLFAGRWWHWAVWAGMARWDFMFLSIQLELILLEIYHFNSIAQHKY